MNLKNIEASRLIALLWIIAIFVGLFYFGGGYIYAMLDKIYGPPKNTQTVRCEFEEGLFKNIQNSFEEMSKICQENGFTKKD